MNDKLLKVLDGKTEIYPTTIEARFPRVFIKIVELCDTKLIEAYLLDLMVDNRGGSRQGFPPEAATEILRLEKYFSTLDARRARQDPWNNIPEMKRLEIEKLGFSHTPQGFLKAVENENLDAIYVFLSCGVDLEVKDERGWTPLMIAAANGKEKLTQMLIHNRARVMAKDVNGFTPLHWAAFKGMTNTVELLLSKDVDIDAQSKFKWTPLMQACTKGSLPVATLLVESGAKTELTNSEGMTALQIASNKGFHEIAQLLASNTIYRKSPDAGGTSTINLADKPA